MSDLIDRQAAIDALVKAIREDPYYDSNEPINGLGVCDVRVILNDLPSAQPEIIRCKECMHNGTVDTDCPIDWNGKEYCNFGERRVEDE